MFESYKDIIGDNICSLDHRHNRLEKNVFLRDNPGILSMYLVESEYMNFRIYRSAWPLLIYCFLGIVSCGGNNDTGDEPTGPSGKAPIILNTSQSALFVPVSEIAQFSCSAYDPDGDSIIYIWSAIYGTFPDGNKGQTVTWKAPPSPYDIAITVSVTDYNFSTRETMFIYAEASWQSHIIGTVYSNTGHGLANASVCAGGVCTTANGSGRFGLFGILPGMKTVTVTAAGYQTFTEVIDLPAGGINHNFYLTP